MHMLNFSDNMKIGILMVALGFLFLFLGMLLFFDAGLLTIGNALLLAGFPFIIGWQKTLVFFNPIKRRDRVRGILCFFGGILLVFLFRWSFIGMMIEMVGLADMFGNFLPNVVDTLRLVPYIGPLFNTPAINWLVERVRGATKRRPPV
jgi:hypothetical protein